MAPRRSRRVLAAAIFFFARRIAPISTLRGRLRALLGVVVIRTRFNDSMDMAKARAEIGGASVDAHRGGKRTARGMASAGCDGARAGPLRGGKRFGATQQPMHASFECWARRSAKESRLKASANIGASDVGAVATRTVSALHAAPRSTRNAVMQSEWRSAPCSA